MTQKAFYEEVIEEIGTQSLARLGLNIFSFNTYAAYGASVQMTNDTAKIYKQHKNSKVYYGYTFEELDVGMQNIKNALLNNDNKTYTTDTLAKIQETQEILQSGKKLENMSKKDREKFESILSDYGDEVKNFDFQNGDLAKLIKLSGKYHSKGQEGLKHHTTTDLVTLDSKGNIIHKSQAKVIKKTEDLLDEKYLENNDSLKVPFDDYKKHRENLEKMIEKGKNSDNPKVREKAEKAQIALEKLNANNLCNRFMCENPNATAVVFQGISAGGHTIQAGISDAIVVALSTLANGIVWEIKDMFQGKIDSEISVLERIQRLFQKTMEAFKNAFYRGAGFGAIDAIVGIVGQIFKSIAKDLKRIWDASRASAKSIYNGICEYINENITSMRELLRVILKSILSATAVVGIVALQKTLEAEMITFLAPIGGLISIHLAGIIAGILSIVAGAFAVVITMRSIDMALDAFFGALDYVALSKQRVEAIATLCAENLPLLIEERQELEILIESTHKERLLALDSSFEDYKIAMENNQSEEVLHALERINKMWDAELKIKTMDDVKENLQQPNRTGCLKW